MKEKTFWIITWATLTVLILLSIWQTLQINALTLGPGIIDTITSFGSQASSGMVGGC